MVSIDNVYQKVLAIANKEQRGYITPQEFNLFADQAQLDIFEQYFYDINQWTRQHGNDHAYADMLTGLEEKINLFKRYNQMVDVYGDHGDANITTAYTIPFKFLTGIVNSVLSFILPWLPLPL